ncbi:bifunctional indole-3-glycerol-phosphate synthase TrpC/phosphoribosylanthranilate isomerase TrpF [Enterobacteriaceae bacterium LUAb1]
MQQETILNKIVQDKAVWVAKRQLQQPLASFQSMLTPSRRSFCQALTGSRPALILECKKASPSKGMIRPHFDPVAIADIYKRYASVISVLTDEKYFQGNVEFLSLVSDTVTQPVLCKDFIIDAYQIYLARHYQADAVLLMLSVLSDEQYQQLATIADELRMGVLTEVSNEEELERAIALKARVVGINNRDLRDLSVDLNRTRQLAPRLAEDVIVISESGINSYARIRALSRFADGFLIGSALMSEPNLNAAVCRMVYGDNKVCGLTRPPDAEAAYQAGAIYGGLIFASGSPRQIDEEQAKKVIAAAPLKYIGVFRDQSPEEIVTKANRLKLHAVQLHGQENQKFISTLRMQLPKQTQIWKAFTIETTLPVRNLHDVDRYLFDSGSGGSGRCFDWSLLRNQRLDNVMLAGGIHADNCREAASSGCTGLDINSGAETAPGIKDASKIAAIFHRLRTTHSTSQQ